MSLLQGLRVIDTSTVIAAPFCTALLADFGADVIKVEMPGAGDPARAMGPFSAGQGLVWPALGRNKRSITLDLRKAQGKDLFCRLIAQSDVLIENFRVGTLDKWGLDAETLRKANPKLIIARLTGFGQTGPNASKAGFGTPLTAFSGMTYISGHKDRPPVSPSFSLLDYIAGLYLWSSVMMALYNRDVLGGKPEDVDVSLYESLFRMLDFVVADYDKNKVIRERNPGLSGGISPAGTFETRDGQWVVVVTSTQRTWEYLAKAMGREDLITNPLYLTNKDRVQNDESLLSIVAAWLKSKDADESLPVLDAAGVPASKLYSIKDIFEDPHYAAREDILNVPHPSMGSVRMPGIYPKFKNNPGEVKWAGPALGEHNKEVYENLLGLDGATLASLEKEGVV
jgi:formyl-CoA transferase